MFRSSSVDSQTPVREMQNVHGLLKELHSGSGQISSGLKVEIENTVGLIKKKQTNNIKLEDRIEVSKERRGILLNLLSLVRDAFGESEIKEWREDLAKYNQEDLELVLKLVIGKDGTLDRIRNMSKDAKADLVNLEKACIDTKVSALVSRLRAERNEAREERNNAQDESDKAQDERDKAQIRAEEAEKRASSLSEKKQKILELQQKSSRLEEENRQLTDENTKLGDSVLELDLELEESKASLKKSEDKRKEALETEARMRGLLVKNEHEIEALEEKVKEQEEKMGEMEKKGREKDATISQLVKEKQDAQQESVANRQDFDERVKQLERDLCGKELTITRLQGDVNRERLYKESAEKVAADNAADYVAKLDRQIHEGEKAIEGRDKQIEEIRRQKDEVESQLKQTNQDLSQANQDLVQTNQDLGQVKGQLERVEGELNQTSSELSRATVSLEHVKGQLNQTSCELIQVKGELNQTSSELIQVKGELNQTSSELIQVKGELNGVKEELEGVKGERNQTSSELIKVKEELNQTSSELSRVRGELANNSLALTEAHNRQQSDSATNKAIEERLARIFMAQSGSQQEIGRWLTFVQMAGQADLVSCDEEQLTGQDRAWTILQQWDSRTVALPTMAATTIVEELLVRLYGKVGESAMDDEAVDLVRRLIGSVEVTGQVPFSLVRHVVGGCLDLLVGESPEYYIVAVAFGLRQLVSVISRRFSQDVGDMEQRLDDMLSDQTTPLGALSVLLRSDNGSGLKGRVRDGQEVILPSGTVVPARYCPGQDIGVFILPGSAGYVWALDLGTNGIRRVKATRMTVVEDCEWRLKAIEGGQDIILPSEAEEDWDWNYEMIGGA